LCGCEWNMKFFADLVRQYRGQNRIATGIKKSIYGLNVIYPEDLTPERQYFALVLCDKGGGALRRPQRYIPFRKFFPIHLSVWRDRYLIERNKECRDHILRQTLSEIVIQLICADAAFPMIALDSGVIRDQLFVL